MSGLDVAVEFDEVQSVSAVTAFTVTVENRDALPIAFKFMTRSADWLWVSPPKGFIPPRSSARIEVLQAPPGDGSAEFPGKPLPANRADSEMAKVEVRALVSTSTMDVTTLPLSQFDDLWKRGIAQDPHTVTLKLAWTDLPEWSDHQRKSNQEKLAVARKAATDAIMAAVAAESAVKTEMLRQRSTTQDLAAAAAKLERRRSVVGIPWILAFGACAASFTIGMGGVQPTFELFHSYVA